MIFSFHFFAYDENYFSRIVNLGKSFTKHLANWGKVIGIKHLWNICIIFQFVRSFKFHQFWFKFKTNCTLIHKRIGRPNAFTNTTLKISSRLEKWHSQILASSRSRGTEVDEEETASLLSSSVAGKLIQLIRVPQADMPSLCFGQNRCAEMSPRCK